MTRHAAPLAAALALAACKGPTVNLATPEPIKVDIDLRLDVYQHAKANQAPSTEKPSTDPAAARRNRSADIQTFKNSRIVGEGRDGLLSIRVDTPGDYGDYVRAAIQAENADRMALMKAEASRQKTSLPEIQSQQAEINRNLAFKGEWIEIEKPDGSSEWDQKGD
jgi:hypothetical protein